MSADVIFTAASDLAAHAGSFPFPIVALDIPDPAPVEPPGMGGVTTLLSWLKWIGYAVVGGAIIVGGILISVSLKRGEGQDALPKIIWPMVGAIVIGGGIGLVSQLAGG